ncbi:MAG: hypothetical protein V1915_00140 [Candidatus Bathyarchaeota archaeon]
MNKNISPDLLYIIAEKIQQLEIRMKQLENEKAVLSKAINGKEKVTIIREEPRFSTILNKKLSYY